MARGWHGNSAGHAKAGQMGGKKSAETRRNLRNNPETSEEFGEQIHARSRKDIVTKESLQPPQE